jgi:hypothetical protein
MNELNRQLKRLLDLARQAPSAPPGDPAPPFLARQVIRQWQKKPSPPRAPQFAWRLAALAGTGLLLMALVLTLMLVSGRDSQPELAATPASSTDDLRDLALLVTEPPVIPIHQSQSAWLSVLVELSERNSK